MCGISGFACTDEVLANTAEQFLRTSWDMMSHRGEDSGGWMATIGDKVDQDKLGGVPLVLLDTDRLRKPNATKMLQVHNRYGTHGRPEENENNHPVKFGDVQITHNGVVHNHKQVLGKVLSLKKYANVDMKGLPEVDSVVIAALVDAYLPDPSSLVEFPDAIAPFFDKCDDVSGSWAFAATWDKYPSYHMVARIDSSPVMFATDGDGTKFIYASESAALQKLCDDVGLNDPNIRQLDEKSALLFKDGKLVQVFKFVGKPIKSYNHTAIKPLPDSLYRLRDGEKFARYNGKFDWVWQDNVPWRAIAYDNEIHGGTMTEIDLSVVPDIMFKQFADADSLFQYKSGTTSRYYAFYGDIEIVTDNGRLLDVFTNPLASVEDYWLKEKEPEIVPPVEDIPFIKLKDFSEDASMALKLIQVSTAVSQFTLDAERRDIERRENRKKQSEAKSTISNGQLAAYYEDYGMWDEWSDETWLKYAENESKKNHAVPVYYKSEKVTHVVFYENVKCKLHACYYVDHRKKSLANCPEAMMSYYRVIAEIENDIVDVADVLDVGLIIVGGKTHDHSYKTDTVGFLEGEKFQPVMKESCTDPACDYECRLTDNPLDTLAELKGLMKHEVS